MTAHRKQPVHVPLFPPPMRPSDLDADAAEAWDAMIAPLTRAGLLSVVDSGMCRMLVETFSQYQRAMRAVAQEGLTVPGRSGTVVRNPNVVLAGQALDRFRLLAADLGLSPTARGKVQPVEDSNASIEALLASD